MTRILAFCIAAMISVLPAYADDPQANDPAAIQFAKMTALVGTWRNAERPDSALRVRFALTAGGTVLVESWERGSTPHSLTLYHRSGPDIIATHYCPQGNQPRLKSSATGPADRLNFSFLDATGLDDVGESHLVALGFDFSGAGYLIRTERYISGQESEDTELRLVREP